MHSGCQESVDLVGKEKKDDRYFQMSCRPAPWSKRLVLSVGCSKSHVFGALHQSTVTTMSFAGRVEVSLAEVLPHRKETRWVGFWDTWELTSHCEDCEDSCFFGIVWSSFRMFKEGRSWNITRKRLKQGSLAWVCQAADACLGLCLKLRHVTCIFFSL